VIVKPRYRGPEFTVFHPSLVLPFALDKALDPRITFTRASSGTYWDENSVLQTATTDEPRFTHNPATGESLGLLVEGAATNLLQKSDDFGDAYWTKFDATISSNAIVAPDGTLTGDKFVEDSGAGKFPQVYKTGVAASNVTHTLSIYAKAGERNWIVVNNNSGFGSYRAWFNLSTGTVGTVDAGITADIHDCGDGWYRCEVARETAIFAAQLAAVQIAPGDGVQSYTGDGSSGLYIWRMQFEVGSKATSSIKTEASTVTRAADSASMTGTNFSSWFNASEGTFVLDAVGYESGQSIVAAQNAAVTNYMDLAWRTSGLTLTLANIVDGGVNQASLSGLSAGSNKTALAYRNNDFALSANGGAPTADSSGAVPSVDRLVFYANSTIKRLAYYPRRLPDAQLQAITS